MNRAILLALLLLGAGCPHAGDSGKGETLRETPRAQTTGAVTGTARDVASMSPGAAICPQSSPVACTDGCCPAGTTCGNPGCQFPTSSNACPGSAPVSCDAPVSCAGVCSALDSSGNGNTLQLSAPSSLSPDRWGGALAVNGSTTACASNATAPTIGFPASNGAITIELWMLESRAGAATLNAANGQQGLVSYGTPSGGTPQIYGLMIREDQVLDWIDGQDCQANTTTNFADGNWHFLAITFDPSTSLQAVYFDGALGMTCSDYVPSVVSGATFTLGAWQDPTFGCTPFNGEIDEVRVLNYSADARQIAGDFVNVPYEVIPGTVALWHFDEGAAHRCCASGSTCDSDGQCGATETSGSCPSGDPVSCGDGTCCPSGTTCSAAGCTTPSVGDTPMCGSSAPVDCGGGLCCPAGTTCDASGVCDVPTATATTPSTSCGSGADTCGSGCCLSGTVCSAVEFAGTAECCPPGEGICAPATCCPLTGLNMTSCQLASASPEVWSCSTGMSPAGCNAGETPCGAVCCTADETCGTGNVCVAAQPAPIDCADGTACGSMCCSGSSVCGPDGSCVTPLVPAACPADAPVACDDGVTCCATGLTCGTSGCEDPGETLPPRGGDTGPACGDGWCDSGEVCVEGGCCPADSIVVCGGGCCPTGSTCDGDECGCPPPTSACGDDCCPDGSICSDGACRSSCDDLDYPTVCGSEECCPSDLACTGGACACPADHPTACGDSCCLAGSSCSNDDCGCPGDQVSCGADCCDAGETCQNGACAAAPASSSGSGSGSCEADGDCSQFSQMTCNTTAEGRCGADHQCHCCLDSCGLSSTTGGFGCTCQPCSAGCGSESTCFNGTCLCEGDNACSTD